MKHILLKRLTYFVACCMIFVAAHAIDLPTQTINGVKYYYYMVKKGDTLYSVSHQLGVSRDDIVSQNPAAADGLHAGQYLYFKYDESQKDTGSGIEPIVEQPHTPTPVKNEVIYINEPVETEPAKTEPAKTEPAVTEPAETEQPQIIPVKKTHEIAIFMPFMLSEHKVGKTAEGATEFYRGFLLGIDTLANYGVHNDIKVSVYDTENKMLTLKKTLANNDNLKTVDLIIAPDNVEQTELLGKWGKKYKIPVLNLFVARDTSYLDNPYMLNANIPTADMLAMAAEKYVNMTAGYKPVILKHKGSIGDKKQFVDILLKQWLAKGIKPIELEFSDRATEQWLTEQLSFMPQDTKYVFISPSASYSDFSRYAMALPSFNDKIMPTGGEIMLLGYPEWTTFKSDALKTMHEDNTVIYTRFFNDANSYDVKNIDRSFEKWYGRSTAEGVPSLGLLGYDAAQFVVKMLNAGSYIPSHDGLQTRFDFKNPSEESGYINNALQIVRFMPGGIIENIAL